MKIAYISTYPPRECGIATFNHNLLRAIGYDKTAVSEDSYVVAMNDSENLDQYEYPREVKYQIRQENQKDYIRAADYINTSLVDACIMEHEFGIYGGENGVYILPLIARLQKPLVTILHTILKDPSYMQLTIIREIAKHSSRIVVMSHRAVGFLTSIYGIPFSKIQLIEHGVPDLEAKTDNPVKLSLPFKNKKVLFTFGLISRNKGLETVIEALPQIVAKNPDVMYVVLGTTHPGVIRNSGEEYRDSLKKLARKLNVEDNLTFINKFVSEEQLFEYLTACDMYITPYLNEAQITSGTLSYAVGAGAAVISTPYWHAQELLADNRGRLFDFKDADALAAIVNELFEDEEKLNQLKANAYEYGLHLRWPSTGQVFVDVLEEAISKSLAEKDNTGKQIIDPDAMPSFSLAHIQRLTDDTGIVQHAKYGIPNLKEGYCLDDNARALIMAILAYQQNKSKVALELLPVYLSYIQYMQRDDGNFRNFLSFTRDYLDEIGSEDSFGRTIWALGYLIHNAPNNSYREFARELFNKSVPHFKNLGHLRGIGNTMIGLSNYLKAHPGDEHIREQFDLLAEPLKAAYRENKKGHWHWFEDKMTYDNAILPLALLSYYQTTKDKEALDIALESMEYLSQKTLIYGYLNPVGNDGWLYREGNSMALYDQQAIETMAMVLMYFKAYEITHDLTYIKQMYLCYQWFLGENSLHLPLFDHETKGCGDGLQPHGVNRNQGAESTLAYWISHLVVLKALEYEYIQSSDLTTVQKQILS
ncbi:glycosyltransferase family 4 protein [Pedobacter heparinus]|uniref:Glycosyl transferase group 1 n=1 Tax=Pedobacter heparinus (strain ATCC 13125 / DSM 2366 / CIP 104194 / JCM 7457 / NBRC 12017 / NCIMB 9290 / NRRL B-14731 / HIM 762-3) TaxID=485917 RepID=C6XTN3_PEDHD|nr:glycosyltransferase family 4 protein [Pedobacter heparinus]ACU03669.1 glycosyl transferase group 1 [Pedobacter heparinus DSM 2366]